MKFYNKLAQFLTIFVMGAALCLISDIKAEATVSFVKSEDSATQVVQNLGKNTSSITKESKKSRSHAPEPTTMALVGGSLVSMIISFFRKMYALTKRTVDVIGAFIGLTLLSPLLLITGILIKLTSKGPVLYSQVRVGKGGKHFNIYKFRTMKVDAEKHTGPVWAAKNDNRLTSIGGILRKSRIDEIPQFVNVFKLFDEHRSLGTRSYEAHLTL